MNPSILLAMIALSGMASADDEHNDTCPPCPCETRTQPTLSVTASRNDPTLAEALSRALEPAKDTLKSQTCATTYMGDVPIAIGWSLSADKAGRTLTWKVEPSIGIALSDENEGRAEQMRGIILAQIGGVGPSGPQDRASIVIYCNKI